MVSDHFLMTVEHVHASNEFSTSGLERGRADRRWFGLWTVIALFVLAVVVVNPLRECPISDDFAYTLTVRNFLRTGQYRLHEFLAPNIPFPTVWGALFCRLFGDTFGALRLSTVVLSVIGLAAFRGLAREHGISKRAADLLTLCVASASLYFNLSLTFMTDAPFASLMMLSLFLYTRALRRMTASTCGAAALAGAALIFTRQFGAAVIPAILIVWLFDANKTGRARYYLLGLSLPLLATAWQVNQGWNHSNYGAGFQLHRQRDFLLSGGFLKDLPWRPTVIVEYLALWLVPLVLLAAAELGSEIVLAAGHREWPGLRRWRPAISFLGWTAFFVAAVIYGWKVVGYVYNTRVSVNQALMPFLSHFYEIIEVLGERFRWGCTVFVVIGAALFTRIIVARWARASIKKLSPADLLLDFTFLFLLALNLLFSQIFDSYLLVYLIYAAIVIGKRLEGRLLDWNGAVICCCVLLFVGDAIWTREELAKTEAQWTLAEKLRETGVPPEQIACDWPWLFYWGFEDRVHHGRITINDPYTALFGDQGWLLTNHRAAPYWIVNRHDLPAPPGETRTIIDQVRYFSVYARGWENFYTIHRTRNASGARAGVAPAH